MIAQKAIGQRLIFTQQTQQQVLRLYVRSAKLPGPISGEKNYAPCFLCIPLEHMPSPRCSQSPLPETSLSLPGTTRATSPGRSLSVQPAPPSQRFNNAALNKPTRLPTYSRRKNLNLSLPQSLNSVKRARPLPPGHDATAARGHNAGQTQGY